MNTGSTTTINGTITGDGVLQIDGTAGANLSTGGILSSLVRFRTIGSNVTVPARTYGGEVTFYNNTGSNYSAILGTASGQTLNFASNFNLQATAAGNLTVDAATNNPDVNINGNISFTKSSTGVPSINMGSGTWTVSGNVDFTNGTVNAGTSTLVMNGTGKTLTSAGQTLNNIDFNSTGTITLNDTVATNGYFKITNGTVNATNRTLNIKGDFNRAGGTFTSTGSTVNLTGGALQTITSGGQAFNNLTITNNSAAGVTFADALTVNGTLFNHTAGSKMTFKEGVTHTIGTINWQGADSDVNNTIKLRSASSGTQWGLSYTTFTTADYLDVQDSNNTGMVIQVNHAKDSGNNTGWYLTSSYVVTGTSPQAGGIGWQEGVTAKDFYNNTISSPPGSTASITMSSSSPTVKFYTSSTYATETTTYTLTNAQTAIYIKDSPSQTETITLTATDGYGKTGTSSEITVTVNPPPSSSITSPSSGSAFKGGVVQILGTASDTAPGFVTNVEVSVDGGNTWNAATNTGTNFSTWKYDWDISLLGSGTYTIKSRATDDTASVETPGTGISIIVDVTPPTKPANLKVYDISNRISGVYQVLLDWTASTDTPSGLKEYEVYRGTEKIGTTTESFYVDTKLKPASYPYSIRAVDKVGNISDSDQAKIDLVSKETLKPVISDISATPSKIVDKDEKTTAMLTWKTDKPSTSLVYYGLGGAKANQTELDTKLNTGHSVVLTNLKPQTTYHFSVSSKDIYGNQVDSQDMTFTTTPAPEKESILDLIIKTLQKAFEWFKKAMAASLLDKLGLIKTPEQVTASMLVFDVSNPDLQKYQALVKVVNKDNFILEKSTDGKSFAQLAQVSGKDYFLDQNLKNSQTYYYKVRGVDGVVSLRPAGLDPTPPTITDIKTKELVVTQDKVEVLLSFQTDKLTTSEVELDGKTLKDDNLNQSHNLFLEDLKPTQTYKFKIKAQTETGIETSSSEQTLTTSTPPPEKTVLQLIIEVLQKAFGGFVKWLKT
jgi:hypothetical protein